MHHPPSRPTPVLLLLLVLSFAVTRPERDATLQRECDSRRQMLLYNLQMVAVNSHDPRRAGRLAPGRYYLTATRAGGARPHLLVQPTCSPAKTSVVSQILKTDIEGFEWEVFDDYFARGETMPFSQILVRADHLIELTEFAPNMFMQISPHVVLCWCP